MTSKATVLSGDLVSSTTLTAERLEQAMEGLEEAAERIGRWHAAPVRFTRNRGDGWQICLPFPAPGLREALAMRAGLRRCGKRLETRIAIACGEVSLPDTGDLNAAGGPGFVDAGQLLDSMKSGRALMGHHTGGALAAAVLLADRLSQSWTPAQARAILPMLSPAPPIHADVGAELGITRQAVRQALDAAGYHAISPALSLLETPC